MREHERWWIERGGRMYSGSGCAGRKIMRLFSSNYNQEGDASVTILVVSDLN